MLWRWLRRLFGKQDESTPLACQQFHERRESVQAQFFEQARASGKPRGLRWKSCDWEPTMEFARDRKSGQLIALLSVTIAFEAIEGSDMEDLPAVGNLRNATALFFYHDRNWQTTGQTLFNLNPDEVIARFASQYERVAS